jgi:hypothetical protein
MSQAGAFSAHFPQQRPRDLVRFWHVTDLVRSGFWGPMPIAAHPASHYYSKLRRRERPSLENALQSGSYERPFGDFDTPVRLPDRTISCAPCLKNVVRGVARGPQWLAVTSFSMGAWEPCCRYLRRCAGCFAGSYVGALLMSNNVLKIHGYNSCLTF